MQEINLDGKAMQIINSVSGFYQTVAQVIMQQQSEINKLKSEITKIKGGTNGNLQSEGKN